MTVAIATAASVFDRQSEEDVNLWIKQKPAQWKWDVRISHIQLYP